jgi:hypothetical protein
VGGFSEGLTKKYVCRHVHMNITIVVNERVWREFKAECVRRGLKASKIMEEYMRECLEQWGVAMKEQEQRKGKTKK